MYIGPGMYVCMHVKCVYVCKMYVYSYVCMYVCMHIKCVYVCMYIVMYVCMYTYMYVKCMYVFYFTLRLWPPLL